MKSATTMHLAVFGYDVPAVQAWLEDRAARGEFLSEYTLFAVFDRGEPKPVRYRLEPLVRKEKQPDRQCRELYETLGWQYVCSIRRKFHIWRCDDPGKPELFTEPETEGGAYHRMLRSLWVGDLILAGMLVLLLCLFIWSLFSDTFLMNIVSSWLPVSDLLIRSAVILTTSVLALYAERSLRRYVRVLRTGVPQPHRRSYRLARGMTGVYLAVWIAWMALCVSQLLRPSSHAFLPVEEFDTPVPYVTLTELGEPVPRETAEALHIPNWFTCASWWSSEGSYEEPPFTLSKYYSLRFLFQAEKLERAWVASTEELGWTLEPLTHPELDGAWLYRSAGDGQVLLVRQGERVLEFQYHGALDLAQRLDVFASALTRFAAEEESP